jgi:hypothetical protein
VGVAPGYEAVFGEQDELRVRVVPYGFTHLLAEGKARSYVGDPDRLIPKALARELLAAFRAADHIDRIRMCVVDLRIRNESVQQGLYGAPRHVGCELATGQVGDHLLVAHLLPLLEREYFVELETRKLPSLYGRQVRSRTFHPQNVDLAPGVVPLCSLGRGIAASVVGDGAVPPQQVGTVGQRFELGEPLSLSLVPQVLRRSWYSRLQEFLPSVVLAFQPVSKVLPMRKLTG